MRWWPGLQKQRGTWWAQGCCGEQGLSPSCASNTSCPCWHPELLWPSCLHGEPRAIKGSTWAQNCSLLLKMHRAESSHLCHRRKAQRDGEHSRLWLVMRSPRSRWPGEPTLTQKPLCTCCWSEGIPGWEPPLLESTAVAKLILTRLVALLNAPVFPRKELTEKGPSVCREQHSPADTQAATGPWSGGHALAFSKGLWRSWHYQVAFSWDNWKFW